MHGQKRTLRTRYYFHPFCLREFLRKFYHTPKACEEQPSQKRPVHRGGWSTIDGSFRGWLGASVVRDRCSKKIPQKKQIVTQNIRCWCSKLEQDEVIGRARAWGRRVLRSALERMGQASRITRAPAVDAALEDVQKGARRRVEGLEASPGGARRPGSCSKSGFRVQSRGPGLPAAARD